MEPLPKLTDGQIAAILTCTRCAWGHHANPVTAATVEDVRDASKSRKSPWTRAELAKLKTP
ncbi:MAG: hypothetical protein CMJ85_05275 [Planctomycetes bacterium]|jgi:hypothetical protein|nr:hypothetical protein [Planctomycetota bacterium]MDP6424961.1 hypothetical protein [Planctomycetota bacterium]